MPGIDRTRPEDMEPIDAAAYLCWGSGRGDLYDAIHAMKKDYVRCQAALRKIENAWNEYPEHFKNRGETYCLNLLRDIARSALQQKVNV